MALMAVLYMSAQAQTCRFPAYTTADYKLTYNMEFDSVTGYMPDSLHRICDQVFTYSLHGLVPSSDDSRTIALTGGSADPMTSNTLPAVLCRLLQGYNQLDINAIKQQYRPADAAVFDQVLADSVIALQYLSSIGAMQSMKLLFTYEANGYTFAMLQCAFNDGDVNVIPFALQSIGGQWYHASNSVQESLGGPIHLRNQWRCGAWCSLGDAPFRRFLFCRFL